MKLTKKLRFLFSLTSLLVCLCMGSVSVNAEVLYDEYTAEEETTTSAEDAKTYANGQITLGEAKSMVEQYVSAISQYASYSQEELEYIADVTSYQTDAYENFVKIAGEDGCGTFSSYDNVTVNELEDENKVEITADMHFEKKDIKIILSVSCFENLGAQVTSTDFSLADAGEKTLGEKMTSAATNTLIGMGVVFCVLIFISLIISCFGIIPKITEKIQNKKDKNQEVQVPSSDNTQTEVFTAEEDNTELIAVIAAAIAASEQTSTDSFVVRSIRRR